MKILKSFGKSLLWLLLFLFCNLIAIIILPVESEVKLISLTYIMFLVAVLIFYRTDRGHIGDKISSNDLSWKSILFIIPITVAVNVILQSITVILPENVAEELMDASISLADENYFISFFILVVLTPITEELLFRGLIFGEMKLGMKVYYAAILSAILFGALHGHIAWALIATCMGVFYAWLNERFKSIKAPVIAHIVCNFMAFLTMIL